MLFRSSLHITQFDSTRFHHAFPESVAQINHVLTIVATVRKLKSEKQVSLKTDVAVLTITAEQNIIDGLKELETLIAGITKAKSVTFVAGTWNVEVAL